jgi:hypothetical protein
LINYNENTNNSLNQKKGNNEHEAFTSVSPLLVKPTFECFTQQKKYIEFFWGILGLSG